MAKQSNAKKVGRNEAKCKTYRTRFVMDTNQRARARRQAKREARFAARRAELGPAKLRKGCWMCGRSERAERQHKPRG